VFSLAERSLYVSDLDLWIDSMRPRSRCYVSHGHSDHAREHDRIVTTPANAKICRSRFASSIARAKQTSLLPQRPLNPVKVDRYLAEEVQPFSEARVRDFVPILAERRTRSRLRSLDQAP